MPPRPADGLERGQLAVPNNGRARAGRAGHESELREYQLGDCLGRGAFGSVFRALRWSTGETVAVKQIKLADLPKSELRVIMLEIDLLKNLDHPNIVKYYGFVKTPETLNIILEYCENGSLHTISKNFGRFPEQLVGLYMSQVLAGLLYLHEQGVIHRDIKGANILTTKQGLVKLADFGVASKTAGLSESSVVGTPYWMAPEVIELTGATTASDIWSLGCTVIELLDGKPPYHQLQPMPALFRIVNDDHPPLPQGASPIVRDFLMQCFQKDPNLRVSAKKLLKHPWIVSAKRSDSVVSTNSTEYTEAVKSVQQWNDALKHALQLPHLRPHDNFAGALSADRLKAFASPAGLPGEDKSRALADVEEDNFSTVRPAQVRSAENEDEGSAHSDGQEVVPANIAPGEPTAYEPKPTSLFRESSVEDFSDIIEANELDFDANLGIMKLQHGKPSNMASPLSVSDLMHDMKLQNGKAVKTGSPPSVADLVKSMKPTGKASSVRRSSTSWNKPSVRRTRSSIEIQRYAEQDEDEDFSDLFAPNSQVFERSSDDSANGLLEEPLPEMDLESNLARDKYARLRADVESLVAQLKLLQDDDALLRISDDLLHCFDVFPETKSVIISAHGVLPILEILENCISMDVVFNLLLIINNLIAADLDVQQNLCFVGGIPKISKYTSKKFPKDIRRHAAGFVHHMYETSEQSLQMFVSAGGLSVLVDFLEDDYDDDRELVLTGVNGIWRVFELQGSTPKNDFCRILSRNSVLEPLSLVLNRVLDDAEDGDHEETHMCEARIASIFFIFSQAENYVKELVAERTVLHRVLKNLKRMSPPNQITMLKFIKNLSMLSTTLDALHFSNAIDVLTDLLKHGMDKPHFREMSNQILNTIYNLCRLSTRRQEDAALVGIIPILIKIVKQEKTPVKEFALPILCDMAHSTRAARRELWQNKGLTFYVSLLSDPYWQVTALDAIFTWLEQETSKVEDHLLENDQFTTGIIAGLTSSKSTSFENLLEPLQKLLRLSPHLAASMAQSRQLFEIVSQRLTNNKPAIRLNLLRIIGSICDAVEDGAYILEHYKLYDLIVELSYSDSAVLVRSMAAELLRAWEDNDNASIHSAASGLGPGGGQNGARRKHPAIMRRTSSGTTPPHLLERQSTTPTSPQLGRASLNLFDPPGSQTPRRQRNGVYLNSGSAVRPVSRDGPTYIRDSSPAAFNVPSLGRAHTTSAVTEMTVNKSRLPRQAPASRLSRRSTRESLGAGGASSSSAALNASTNTTGAHSSPASTLTPVAESKSKENRAVEVTQNRRQTTRRTADERWS
ncbi:hypothetical protein DV735_g4061, partial [Chaetothyriales sp. CBS 134920]